MSFDILFWICRFPDDYLMYIYYLQMQSTFSRIVEFEAVDESVGDDVDYDYRYDYNYDCVCDYNDKDNRFYQLE